MGDLLQLKPAFGSYIVTPNNDPIHLWRDLFQACFLKQTSRQSDDNEYASLLNKIRFEIHTPDDIELLKSKMAIGVSTPEWFISFTLVPNPKIMSRIQLASFKSNY